MVWISSIFTACVMLHSYAQLRVFTLFFYNTITLHYMDSQIVTICPESKLYISIITKYINNKG
ncbi:hypothetical protein GFC29_2965 [Anoxybacillus sp. B7M1]|nr:hypothetical protein GFC28_2470 [Anoxybacillus sp. B2M1]ANB65839.1 hypothetical protein GFC29_2965 [Anoxybacillus sp. B7M1]KXG09473.1 hypothetical protein AT864_02192 [Anoxybacillus sp. P3H1B]